MQPGNEPHANSPQQGWQGNPGRQNGPGYAQPGYGSPYGGPPPGASSNGPLQGPPPGYAQGPTPFGGSAPGPMVAGPRRGRPGLIVVVSFLVQLVVIAAGCNQGVSDRIQKFSFDHSGFVRVAAQTPLVYSWRFAPDGRDNFHAYPAMMFSLLALFVLAAALTFALVRGPITFFRAFFGVWLAVIVATLLAGMVRRAVIKDVGQYPGYGNKAGSILFAGGGNEVIAGITLGFLAALVAAIVAVVSRRPAIGPVLPLPAPNFDREPEPPPPYYGEDVTGRNDDPSQRLDDAPRRGEYDDSRTMSMQKLQGSVGEERDAQRPDGEQRTQTLPAFGADGPDRSSPQPQSSPQPGTQQSQQASFPPPTPPVVPSTASSAPDTSVAAGATPDELSRTSSAHAESQGWPPSGVSQPPEDATTRLPRFDPSAPPPMPTATGPTATGPTGTGPTATGPTATGPAAGRGPSESTDGQQQPPERRDTTDEATRAFPRPPDDDAIEDPEQQ